MSKCRKVFLFETGFGFEIWAGKRVFSIERRKRVAFIEKKT